MHKHKRDDYALMNNEVRMKIERMLKELNEATGIRALEVGVQELPGEGLGYWDGFLVIGSKDYGPLYILTGENSHGGLTKYLEIPHGWMEDQLGNTFNLMGAYTPQQIKESWVVDWIDHYAALETIMENHKEE